ncbi:hypothetical protein ACWEP2_41065, partial [Streptomyces sp. NPDC004279]
VSGAPPWPRAAAPVLCRCPGRTGRGRSWALAVPGAVGAGVRAAVFGSTAVDPVPGDTDGAEGIFVRRARRSGPPSA